ncbi:MAG TPA: Maf family protein [Petrotogaceae bacterium]|jgi:septum formation protein|nr:Maf family protein [Petrotogaceae bacterium]HPG47596.1 Maf family protein [Petrotogaceae bacterium]HQO11846.1 Maf family protein [Petrotogaceae bacterium]
MTLKYRLVLGSGSARRKELLKFISNDFRITVSDIDEECSQSLPELYVQEVALNKSKALKIENDELLITADTIVFIEDKFLGKPRNREHAFQMLKKLSGAAHKVYTGVCLRTNLFTDVFYECTEVFFRELSDNEIYYYIDAFSPYDKAGAYGIQDFGLVFIQGIKGDYYNVMGFPVTSVYKKLLERGIIKYE